MHMVIINQSYFVFFLILVCVYHVYGNRNSILFCAFLVTGVCVYRANGNISLIAIHVVKYITLYDYV